MVEISPLLSPEPLPPVIDLSSATEQAILWTKNCHKDHRTCHSLRQGSEDFLPTRLIDVGTTDTDAGLRLCDTKAWTSPVPAYMTLSHCWGSLDIIRLLESNYTEFCNLLPMSKLPKTFQDAINVTRRLGVQYLWIDTLCIIQDSREDWLYESARMASIYSNSHCNISATAAKDGSVGCFIARSQASSVTNVLKIETAWQQDNVKGAFYAISPDLWLHEVDEAPLNQRGWVFQERFLAPRNLSFGAQQIFWECEELRASELFPGGLPKCIKSTEFRVSSSLALSRIYDEGEKPGNLSDSFLRGLLLFTGGQFTGIRRDASLDPIANRNRHWSTLLSHYCERALSYESDRLTALYGIVSWLKTHLFVDDTYVAGLWKNRLVNQLLWTTYFNLRKSRPQAYRAPSWSWAAINGKVSFRDISQADMDFDRKAQLVDVEVNTRGEVGEIISARLVLAGLLFSASWKGENTYTIDQSSPHSAKRYWHPKSLAIGSEYIPKGEHDWATKSTQRFSLRKDKGTADEGYGSVYGFPDVEVEPFSEAGSFCFALQWKDFKNVDQAKMHRNDAIAEGLVLQAVGHRDGVFKRVGWFMALAGCDADFLEMCGTLEDKQVTII